MPVANHAPTTVGKSQLGFRGQECLELRIDRPGNQPSRAGSQNFGEQIIDRPCLSKGNFSLPGLLIVTTHFDLLNSSEANKLISFARAVVATAVAEVTDWIGCIHAGVEAQPTKSGRRPPA